MNHRISTWVCLVGCIVGCRTGDKASDVRLGEPVGVHLAASDGIEAFDVAFAVDEGVALDPLVPVLSAAIHQAVAACPAFIEAGKKTRATRVAMLVEKGVITSVNILTENQDDCVDNKLERWTLEGAPPLLHVIADVRFAAKKKDAKP